MSITLNIAITSPLTPDDHELLSGIAVMTLAIANHELAKDKFPEAFGDDDGLAPEPRAVPEPPETPEPCGLKGKYRMVCVSLVGHRGQHRFRLTEANAGPVGTN